MSKLGDYVATILAGGLPAVLDNGMQGTAGAQKNPAPERTAPAGTNVDRDTAKVGVVPAIQWKQIAIVGGGIVAVGAIMFVAMKLASSRG